MNTQVFEIWVPIGTDWLLIDRSSHGPHAARMAEAESNKHGKAKLVRSSDQVEDMVIAEFVRSIGHAAGRCGRPTERLIETRHAAEL